MIESDGYAILPRGIEPDEVDTLRAALSRLPAGRPGWRRILALPEVQALALHPRILAAAELVLGAGCFAVGARLFDKSAAANWLVAWHQDRTIAVRERRDTEGFGPWSVKDGVTHVQAPAHVLERMVAVRVHLDPCAADNGALRVLPGSHRDGVLTAERIAAAAARPAAVACGVPCGGLLLLRPLLLHASSKARVPGHRRVLHIDFAAGELPPGLRWHERVAPPGSRCRAPG